MKKYTAKEAAARAKTRKCSPEYREWRKTHRALPHVKAMRRADARRYYAKHATAHKIASTLYGVTRRQHITTLKKYYGGCVDCGYNEHPEALDFDHRPGTVKKFPLGSGWKHSWDAILNEIAKCDLVCANCHRVRTANRRAA